MEAVERFDRKRSDAARVTDQVSSALGRAFAEDALRRWFVPDDARRRRVLPWFEGWVLRYCLRYGEVVVSHDRLGASCWLPPGDTVVRIPRAIATGSLLMPVKLGPRGLARVLAYERIAEAMHEASTPGPHWYLFLLGVDPAAQGRGLSRALVTPMIDRADAEGVPCYLETQTPGNVAIYERFGFAVAERRDVAPGVVTIGMRRSPA